MSSDEERRAGDVWTDTAPGLAFNSHERLHPNEKPLTLMRKIICGASKPSDMILDPYCGSGTTLLAARLEGRKAIGVEISEDYCRIAVERLRQGVFGFDSEG